MSLGFMGAHLKCHMGDSKYMSSVFAPDLIISRVLYNSLNVVSRIMDNFSQNQ